MPTFRIDAFWDFQKKEHYFGLRRYLWIFFFFFFFLGGGGVTTKLDCFGGYFSVIFTVNVQNGNAYFGMLKFQKQFGGTTDMSGVLGVTIADARAKPTMQEKLKVPPGSVYIKQNLQFFSYQIAFQSGFNVI